MCHFLSFIVTIEKHPKVLCLNLKSHDTTILALDRKEETYRECEWTMDDTGASLHVRTLPREDPTVFTSAILAKYPTRRACLVECLRQMADSGRNLDYDLSGCDLKGITLPQSIGGSLDLRGCDLKGITLPQSIGEYLDLSGCNLKGITLPQSIGGSLYLRGCDLKGITLPQSIGGSLDLSGCNLKGITLPQSIGGSLYLSDCDLKGITLPQGIRIIK